MHRSGLSGGSGQGLSGAQVRDNALSNARLKFRSDDRFNPGLDPEKAKEFHHEMLPKDAHRNAHFCSMAITQKVRDQAVERGVGSIKALDAGNAEKAAEFHAQGERMRCCVVYRDLMPLMAACIVSAWPGEPRKSAFT